MKVFPCLFDIFNERLPRISVPFWEPKIKWAPRALTRVSTVLEKIYHAMGQRPSVKCRLSVVRTHMNYLLPIGNVNVLWSQPWTHFILPSEFWISIYNYENARLPWNLQIYRFSKIVNSDTNWIFLIPFKTLHLYTLEIYIARK